MNQKFILNSEMYIFNKMEVIFNKRCKIKDSHKYSIKIYRSKILMVDIISNIKLDKSLKKNI